MSGSGTGERTEPHAAELMRLRAALKKYSRVNLTGPPGVGKTRLTRQLRAATVDLDRDLDRDGDHGPERAEEAWRSWWSPRAPQDLLVVDSIDEPHRTAALRNGLDAAGVPRRLLFVSRRPLLAAEGWTDSGIVTLRLPPLPDHRIEAITADAGIDDPEARAVVVRLAGGVPLLAAAGCRALHAGAEPSDAGAIADQMTGELLERLGRELPGSRWRHALRLLATVGAGDEQLLSAGPDLFAQLGRLSVVTRTPLGLSVREPFRTVLETAYLWRRPTAHHAVRSRAAAYRHTLLTRTTDPSKRAELVGQRLFLTGDPQLRRALFPASESAARIGVAQQTDADDIGRLTHRWARRGGFDPARAERVTERWLDHGPSVFRLARDGDGRAVGLASLLPVHDTTSDAMEPLLQQHTGRFVTGPRSGGLFLGAAYATDPAVHARILRDILACAVRSGHLVVSTATPDYQLLVRGLGFRAHGSVHDDVYRCGRRPEVFSNAFTAAALPRWLDRLGDAGTGGGGAGQPDGDLVEEIARALGRIRDPAALEGSALLVCPATPTVADLRSWLHSAVQRLADSEETADAEAGAILQAYYLARRRGTHHQVACRLHLGRATYFRRLRRGLTFLAVRLSAAAADPGRADP